MITVSIADLTIKIENKYDYIVKKARDYLVDTQDADFTVCVSDEEILAEGDAGQFSAGYLEYLAIYRKIAEEILKYDGLLLHGVLLECEGKGVLFGAKSGVGKSTHAALWKKLLGDKCTIVNGDKPLVRIIDGRVFAYGTPWNGKEGLHENKKCELFSLCFLERGEENKIWQIGNEALRLVLTQTYMPKNDSVKMVMTLDMLDKILSLVKCFRLACNMDISAAKVAYEELIK
ncbi:MAG: hypothetical protein IKU84_06985 [Clostridia bacterium]|nr:hypothetical protein [Clostridia bacterium]